MDRKKKFRLAATPVALAALVAPMAFGGCDSVGNPIDAVCCSDFKPGTNMIDVDWGLEGNANLEFGAAMQAVGDFSATAQAMVTDLGVACKGLAIDLGSAETAVPSQKDPNEFTKLWCAEAAKQIGTIKGQITINAQPAKCEVNVSAKVDCQAQCSASAECKLTPAEIKASCMGGKLSGTCTAQCSGECRGSANLAVTCNGKCQGTCEGQCDGMPSGAQCSGVCSGECRGTCEIAAGAMATCEGTCSGDCSVDFQAPKCEGTFKPAKAECQASASCEGSCDASASAKAECTPPSVDIAFTGNIDQKVAALKKWLPQIYLNIEGRLGVLQGQLTAITNVAGNFEADLTGSASAAFCIVPAVDALANAGINITATAAAGVSLTTALPPG